MSIRDLTQKYKRQKARQAVNAAIREELPGGAELLDLTSKFERLRYRANGNFTAEESPLSKRFAPTCNASATRSATKSPAVTT